MGTNSLKYYCILCEQIDPSWNQCKWFFFQPLLKEINELTQTPDADENHHTFFPRVRTTSHQVRMY
jgi:hypothetical protein